MCKKSLGTELRAFRTNLRTPDISKKPDDSKDTSTPSLNSRRSHPCYLPRLRQTKSTQEQLNRPNQVHYGMRQLKHHEKKLLKKVDFLQWKSDDQQREVKVMRKYHVQKREDYQAYNRLCGSIRSLLHRLSQLPPQDPFRAKQEGLVLAKLYDMGLVDENQKVEGLPDKVTVSAFCRRRLPVVMSRIRMSETVRMASQYVEQGHVRVGPDTITDPAFLVTRNMQDFVTWVDSSKLKRTIAAYNDELDDYDLL